MVRFVVNMEGDIRRQAILIEEKNVADAWIRVREIIRRLVDEGRKYIRLNCSHNQLTELPDDLPNEIIFINCSSNQLTRLPDALPRGSIELWCHNNQLTILP